MDVLQVVRQLRDLTANPQNRATIVRVSHTVVGWSEGRAVLISNVRGAWMSAVDCFGYDKKYSTCLLLGM